MAKIWPKPTLLAIKVINWILMNSRACKTMLFWLFHPFYNYFLHFELQIQAKMRAWDKSLFESNITTAMQPVMCGCARGILGILIITNSITWEQCNIRNRATLFEYFNLICSAITVIVTRNYKHSIANNDFLLGLISGEHFMDDNISERWFFTCWQIPAAWTYKDKSRMSRMI